MTPYADFTYFGLLLLYAAIPAIVLGYFGLANKRLALAVTLLFLWLQYKDYLFVRPAVPVREIWIVCGYAAYQWALASTFLRFRTKPIFIPVLILAILPLAVAKYLPDISPASKLGFAGISYVSFRALDVIFSIRDKVVTALPPVTYFAFLFFVPAVSSGPIDRFRRFSQDWIRRRSRAEFTE